ncbi:MAG: hypothetical protein H0W83_13335, partial [Planctomycetes bacterium]|nr:hypothetical protein [Planctomycetota bacterium]
MRALHRALLIVACLSISTAASAAVASTPVNDDRPIAFGLKAERATIAYRVQGDRPIEHAVADALVLGGQRFPARTTDKGQLELELAGDGKFAPARPGPLTVTLGKSEDKHRAKIDVFLSRASDGSWAYRTITRLSGQIGDEHVTVIDVDGDGAFNQPGVDAIVLGASEYAFPLPAGDERWCVGSLDVTGLSFGPLGEQPKISGRMLATMVPETLAVLKGINDERLKLGLTPRPENTTLSAPLQKHCAYMVGTGTLAHPEVAGTPNY